MAKSNLFSLLYWVGIATLCISTPSLAKKPDRGGTADCSRTVILEQNDDGYKKVPDDSYIDSQLPSGCEDVDTPDSEIPIWVNSDNLVFYEDFSKNKNDAFSSFDTAVGSSKYPYGPWTNSDLNSGGGDQQWSVNSSGLHPGLGWNPNNYGGNPGLNELPDRLISADNPTFENLEPTGVNPEPAGVNALRINSQLTDRSVAWPESWTSAGITSREWLAGVWSTHADWRDSEDAQSEPHGFQFTGGFAEACIDLPHTGSATRVAFWLYSDSWYYNVANGTSLHPYEIDIMEFLPNYRVGNTESFELQPDVFTANNVVSGSGTEADPYRGILTYDTIFHTYHYKGSRRDGPRTPTNWTFNLEEPYKSRRVAVADAGDTALDFGDNNYTGTDCESGTLYSVSWEPARHIKWYVNRVLIHEVLDTDVYGGSAGSASVSQFQYRTSDVYDGSNGPMYVNLSSHLGFALFEGADVDDRIFESDGTGPGMDVHWVKVWQNEDDSTHKWCGIDTTEEQGKSADIGGLANASGACKIAGSGGGGGGGGGGSCPAANSITYGTVRSGGFKSAVATVTLGPGASGQPITGIFTLLDGTYNGNSGPISRVADYCGSAVFSSTDAETEMTEGNYIGSKKGSYPYDFCVQDNSPYTSGLPAGDICP